MSASRSFGCNGILANVSFQHQLERSAFSLNQQLELELSGSASERTPPVDGRELTASLSWPASCTRVKGGELDRRKEGEHAPASADRRRSHLRRARRRGHGVQPFEQDQAG